MDALDACDERIFYFQIRNNPEMVRHSAIMLLSYIHLAKAKIELYQTPKTRASYMALLRNHTKKILKNHKDIPIYELSGIYEFVYPFRMRLYWYGKALIDKMHLASRR